MELEPVKSKNILLPMARRGNRSKGQKITNHFRANFTKPNSQHFFHYSVALTYEMGVQLKPRELAERFLKKLKRLIKSIWVSNTLLMMATRISSLSKFVEPARITKWAVVNFFARCDTHRIISDLIRCGKMKGINIDPPFYAVFEENPQFKYALGSVRVEKMFEQIKSILPEPPRFFLCILSERKNSDAYVNVLLLPQNQKNDQYLTHVLLKINAKLGGLNPVLAIERSRSMPLVMRVPTIIIGMDVSHGSPGQSDVPSIAAGCEFKRMAINLKIQGLCAYTVA
ncbi:unnamed protein product [Arabis nemorensis]|uniref:Piwi domain-containing protein n=1 Tax=Arabis nemorensis TaxID=586526 RepID=A0A565CT37_9BRAS|nr:unnamed protein product [Arabis nemorensis]